MGQIWPNCICAIAFVFKQICKAFKGWTTFTIPCRSWMSIATIYRNIPETWRVERGGWVGRHGVCIVVALHLCQKFVRYLRFLAAGCELYMPSVNAVRKNGRHAEGRRSWKGHMKNWAVLVNRPLVDWKSEDAGVMKSGNPLAAAGERGKVRRKKNCTLEQINDLPGYLFAMKPEIIG